MRPNDTLHELILTMDKQERIYFKARFLTGEQSGQRLLFCEIEKQKKYDETILKKKLAALPLIKRFAQLKNHLYHLVLESLILYHADKTEESRARKMVEKATMLIRKGMAERADKLIKSAKPNVIQTENHLLLLELLENEYVIIRTLPANRFNAALEQNEQEFEEVLSDYNNLRQYQWLESRVYDRKYVIPRSIKESTHFEKILQHPLLSSVKKARSNHAKYLFYHIRGACFRFNGQFEKSLKERSAKLNLLAPLASVSNVWLHRYSSSLYQMAIAYKETGKSEKALSFLYQIYDLKKKFPSAVNRKSESVFFKRAAMIETDMCIRLGNTGEGLKRVTFIEEELKRHGNLIDRDVELAIRYNLALMAAMSSDWKLSAKLISKVINLNEKAFAEDLLCFARILNLVIHIELDNTDLLFYICRQTIRFLKKRKRFYKTEEVVLNFCMRLLRGPAKENEENPFSWLERSLEQVLKKPSERSVTEFFDFNLWLQSRRQKVTMAELVVRNRAQKV